MRTIKKILFILCLLLNVGFIFSQTDSLKFPAKFDRTKIYKVKTKEGASYIGYIIQHDSNTVKVENKNTERVYTINTIDIESINEETPKKQPKQTELYGENDHADTYIVAQSALPLGEGKIKATYHWLVVEHIDLVLNDNWAITANTLLFAPASIGVKCHYPINDDWHIGANVFGTGNILSATSSNATPFFGVFAMGKLTKGQSNKNVTASAGALRLYVANGINLFNTTTSRNGNIYFASIAFCNRFSERLSVVGESWYFPQIQANLTGIGLKLVGNPQTSWTFGCYGLYFGRDINFNNLKGRLLPVPYLGYSSTF